jgi:hypothetical protein
MFPVRYKQNICIYVTWKKFSLKGCHRFLPFHFCIVSKNYQHELQNGWENLWQFNSLEILEYFNVIYIFHNFRFIKLYHSFS